MHIYFMKFTLLVLFALLTLCSSHPHEVIMKDISYGTHERHKLDIYHPGGVGPYPVVIFVHGGAWSDGSKDLYPHLGNWLARHNIIGVLVNYRLSPAVVHPSHVRDVASSIAWVHAHIAEYGGDTDKLYLTGFSAGGHLAALIATNPVYLREHGLSVSMFKGIATYSGVYSIDWTIQLAGYGGCFEGSDWEDASPLHHVHAGLPPWVVIYATNDFLTLDGQAKVFYEALRAAGVEARLMVFDSDHPMLTENMVDSAGAAELIRFFRSMKEVASE